MMQIKQLFWYFVEIKYYFLRIKYADNTSTKQLIGDNNINYLNVNYRFKRK